MKFNPLVTKTTGKGEKKDQKQPKFGWKPEIPVTIVKVRIENSEFHDDKTGSTNKRGTFWLHGVQDGGEEERWYPFSAGKCQSKDGINFDYPPHESSAFAKLCEQLVAAGFDPESLKNVGPDGVVDFSLQNLVGHRFLFEMVQAIGQDGVSIKRDKNGFPIWTPVPVKYLGTGDSLPSTPSSPDNTLRDETVALITKLLSDNEGFLGRVDLIKKLTQATAGNPNAPKILALATKESFHTDVPWTRDSAGYKLAE